MDRIAEYADSRNITTIKLEDLIKWRKELERVIKIGQPMLQTLLEYRAYGCNKGDPVLDQMIEELESDLKLSRSRVTVIMTVTQ